ncbi:MAG: HAMP domain-containing sensor histidine kinase [Phycisphaerales bacterium]
MANLLEKRKSLNKEISEQLQQKKELEARLSRLQALANLGTLTAMVAHEINNILMPLGNYANVALSNPNDKALTEKALKKTVYNSGRASEILESILSIVNGEAAEKKICRLKQLVDEVFSCMGRDFEKDCIKANIQIPEDLDVRVVPVQMQQVLMNLILNAREAMLPGGGILTISAQKDGNSVVIDVADTGSGITPENMGKIFQPFFSTKTPKTPAARVGAGLGLLFCKEIIESHEGTIEVDSGPGKGTKFSITLPE